MRILAVMLSIGLLAVGCSQEPEMTAPDTQTISYDKNGTETLGPPSIDIASGSCFAQGGVGMVGTTEGTLEINVPAGDITQVLLYWAGGTTGAPGDDMVKIDGNDVTGELIGGPAFFFQASGQSYYFSSYRADITDMSLVTNGDNSFTISDFDFDFTGGVLDENNGIGMLVIYDDGTTADIQVLDGLDLAFYQFADPRDATVPQTFTFAAEDADRMARIVIFSGSVGFERPNGILFTTTAGPDLREDLLGSNDGELWDTLCLTDILIPAGDTSLTVELISTPVANPLGASLAWVGAGFSLPVTPPTFCIGDYVWFDENGNGCQDEGELGVEDVEVNLWMGCPPVEIIATTLTGTDGDYAFCGLEPGDYTVQFTAPDGYFFCEPFSSACGTDLDSNAGSDGITDCVTIVDADDWTIDAALCMPPQDGCTLTIGFWKTHAGFGPQADVVTQYLPIWLGEDTGAKSLQVTSAAIAVDVLKMKTYGTNDNGITKLYAQLLAAKLNIASGAGDGSVADFVDDADAFLADHDYMDWAGLSAEDKDMVMMWQGTFDDYNNGDIGPGHCGDDEVDDLQDMKFIR
jgi:hypothetical protein